MNLICAYCGKAFEKDASAYRYAIKKGQTRFMCSNACVGLFKKRPPEEKRADWLQYLKDYHAKNRDRRLDLQRKQQKESYDPVKRRKKYDAPGVRDREIQLGRVRYAKANYGDGWEAFRLIMEIKSEVLNLATKEQIRAENGYFKRRYEKRKNYERPNSEEPQECPLGNLERGERR